MFIDKKNEIDEKIFRSVDKFSDFRSVMKFIDCFFFAQVQFVSRFVKFFLIQYLFLSVRFNY